MSRTPTAERVKRTYTDEARRLATRSLKGLEGTSVTPDALTVAGVALCIAGAVVVYFEYVSEWLFLAGAALFVVGSVLDILDGALARRRGTGTPFGAFLDSTVDRVGEGFMIGAVGLVLVRDGSEWGVALAFAAVAGSFLVSYTRAKAEILGLRGDVGIGSRAERVVVITAGLVFAPLGALPWTMAVLTATAWVTVVQRVLAVRSQLRRS
ncbi:MAG TPA: CDP-alcohol phosphatidyltransferase family protein [Gaiellaceae bacterium]|nr:CDP-alcohol phosphatidyltransferase family protein [Gaiellaceae bacterium]